MHLHVLRTLISFKSYLVTVCQRTGAFHIFLLLQCLFVLRALCNLTVSDWLGNQPRSFPAHSLNKQMLVSAHLLVVVSLYEEPLPKRKSSSSHKQITFPYHYLEKETDVKYDFRQLVSSSWSKIIHSVEAAKYAARLLSKVHSKLLHKLMH